MLYHPEQRAHDGMHAPIHGHIFVHDHGVAVKILDIDIAYRTLRSAPWVEEAGLGWDDDGIGTRGDAGVAHVGFEVAVAVDIAKHLAAHHLVHAGGAKPAIDNGADHRLLALGADEATGDAPVGRPMIGRADAHEVDDLFGAAVHAHPVPCEQATLGVAYHDDLFCASYGKHGIDIGAELPRRFRDGLRGAVTVVRGKDRPAVLAQDIAHNLPDALGIAGAVDQDDWPGALVARAGAPIVFENAARLRACAEGQGPCGIGIEGGIAGTGLVLFGLEAVNDLVGDVILQSTGRGRGGDAKAWRIFFFGCIFLVHAPEFEELFRNNAFQLCKRFDSHAFQSYALMQVNGLFRKVEEIYGESP